MNAKSMWVSPCWHGRAIDVGVAGSASVQGTPERQQPMNTVHFTAETSSNGVTERDFTLGEVTGVLWSPASGSEHAPLVLMGHGGGLHKKTPNSVPCTPLRDHLRLHRRRHRRARTR